MQVTSPQYSTETRCDRGFADGAGNVLTERTDGAGTTFRLFSPSGAQVGGDLAFWLGADIAEQAQGFIGTNHTTSATAVFRIDPDGSSSQLQSFLGEHGFSAPDPTGGMVVWMLDTNTAATQSGFHAYDPSGNPRWFTPFSFGNGAPMALGVDRAGNTLFLWKSYDDANRVRGVWLDPAGALGSPFDVHDDFGTGVSLELRPQVGSGLFLRAIEYQYLADGTVEIQSQWVDAFAARSTAPQAAPDWLAFWGNSDLAVIRNGAGYAVLPNPTQMTGCAQTVSILAPDGTACGSQTFTLSSQSCTTAALTVGRDGTLIQQVPKSLESCTAGGNCPCDYRWWPGYLR